MAKPGMATDSRGYRPVTTLQTDIPSDRLIIGRVDDPLEDRGATGDISRSGVQIPPTPLRFLKQRIRLSVVTRPEAGPFLGLHSCGDRHWGQDDLNPQTIHVPTENLV